MNRELLEALGALAADFYFDALQGHPGLLDPTRLVDDEALVIWRVLLALDELWIPLQDAKDFGRPELSSTPVDEDLPF